MCVHDIESLFEAAILNKANYFTVKGRNVVSVFVQNYNRRENKHISKHSVVQINKKQHSDCIVCKQDCWKT